MQEATCSNQAWFSSASLLWLRHQSSGREKRLAEDVGGVETVCLPLSSWVNGNEPGEGKGPQGGCRTPGRDSTSKGPVGRAWQSQGNEDKV